MKYKFTSIALLLLLSMQSTMAADVKKELSDKLKNMIPGKTPASINDTPVPGLYEVNYGTEIYYVSADGKYLLDGDLINLKTRVSLTGKAKAQARANILASVAKDDTINYPPKGETKHVVTIFTDIDCPYCRKLHHQMDEYNKLGIEIRYMMFPRAGLNSPSFDKAVSVWCADDNEAAMTIAKDMKPVKPLKCDNPVADQYNMGQSVGVTGTPAIFTESGEVIPGYRPPAALLKTLEQMKAN